MSSSSTQLTPSQAQALFDILAHHETYSEIENFKWPDAIDHYGPPFQSEKGTVSTSPLLQTLLSKFALPLPGLRDVSTEFWQTRVRSIVADLAAAELSESYDKGAIGSRKTLATALSAIFEYPARGCFGGYPKRELKQREYDVTKAEDVLQGWDDFQQSLIYGNGIDELMKKGAETDKLEDHTSLVQAAHEYIVINIASFLYYTLVLSPDGQSILRMAENLHRLIPYSVIRQTLRVGNAATMINGMVRLCLAKLSVTAFTNWVGLTKAPDEGMNLMQQIISTTLWWDTTELKKRAERIERQKDAPSKEHLDAINDYLKKPREAHEQTRDQSRNESKSVVTVISENASVSTPLNADQHTLALEYFSLKLSIRDRDMLTKILCRSTPDHLTQAVRDLVTAYDPIIRACHNAVDLSDTVTDAESFITDLIKVAKLPPPFSKKEQQKSVSKPKAPSVEDFVKLIKRHIPSSHKFLHQIAKNGPEMTGWFKEYAHHAVKQFRAPLETSDIVEGAGSMTQTLSSLILDLPQEDRKAILDAADAHASYLARLSSSSVDRLRATMSSTQTKLGPGIYLARWQDLLDSTLIAPSNAKGPVRKGADKQVREAAKMDVDGKERGVGAEGLVKVVEKSTPRPPESEAVWERLRDGFRKALRERVEMG
ncbi:hypothetical protein M501DRAFT_1001147 [Patellaria atrata CBS 101060]|uniref:Px domain containing protein n=1 Tax=Patellaria atrata CBS 101060 TaxID=1346257 RepID=A0A9P4VNH8_9PEZI|nr:hypothetical protein M501DRAFT_1001147 [Patellaria atrata CBS 101060]